MARRPLSAATSVALVIGDPVAHSMSPAIHNAGFEACDLDWVFLGAHVPAGGGAEAIAAFRALGLAGMSVTMPLKAEVANAVDICTPVAAHLGAVNCVYWSPQGQVVGDNTDGAGAVWALESHCVGPLRDQTVGVVGAGGAARAVIAAVAAAGCADILVVNRSPEAGLRACEMASEATRLVTTEELGACSVLINATSVGMTGAHQGLPTPASVFNSGQLVMDLVYHPLHTAWLEEARACGAHTVDGLEMLVGQAGAAFERWTGCAAPYEVLREAARNSVR